MDNTLLVESQLAGLNKFNKATLCGGLATEEYFYKAEEVAALVAKLLPAPLADAALAELERTAEAAKRDWTSNIVGWHPAGNLVEFHDHDETDAAYISNARPDRVLGLLARLRAAEAFKAKVVEVLSARREAAYADFTTYLEEGNDPNAPIPGAEAGEEINRIARALGLGLEPTETVKGGQPHA